MARRAAVSVAALLALAAAPAAQASPPASGNLADRISWPYSCRFDHGRLHLEPGAEQIHHILGAREQRPFAVCRDRQNCRTQTLHRFVISCGGQRAAWADIVAVLADKGHPRLALADGRLGVLIKPVARVRTEPPPAPPGRMLSGWCSDQFGGPTQPFLRQACQEARRLMSNLGGPPHAPARQRIAPASPQFVAFPKGFAPLRDAGARLLPPLLDLTASAPAGPAVSSSPPQLALTDAARTEASETKAGSVPALTAPEPNDRSADPASRLPRSGAAGWITHVHLASATVAASSDAAAERQRQETGSRTLYVTIMLAGLLAAAMATATLRRRKSAASASRSLGTATDLALRAAPGSMPPGRTAALLSHRLRYRMAGWHRQVRSQAEAVLTRHRRRTVLSRQLPPMTPDQLAALSALPPDLRLIMTARDQLADRIDHLRQTIAPLHRTGPALHAALARDLMAGERRLAKITIASLTANVPGPVSADTASAEQTGNAERKRAQTRLQRVTADLDRLQEIIAGAVTSLARDAGPRPLPRDLPEAYLALGVNAGVNLSTLKKLVDALRVSWHPDLATSDEDRLLRDERIKEINVAWDLIAGKRGAG